MKADREKINRMLKTARGQMDGVLKMVEEDRYCLDISNQIMATQAILRKVNREILHSHLQCCVSDAFAESEQSEKIQEMIQIIDKLSK